MKKEITGLMVFVVAMCLAVTPVTLSVIYFSSAESMQNDPPQDQLPTNEDNETEPTKEDPNNDNPTKEDPNDDPTKEDPDDGSGKEDPEDDPIQATIDVKPNTLNVKSKGRWIKVYIELPDGYDIQDINIETVFLNDSIQAETSYVRYGDYDEDGIPDLKLKFNRSEVIDLLEEDDQAECHRDKKEVEIFISGKMIDGISIFEGCDLIKVII